MSAATSVNNKRIAKNTLLLYFRMFFMMLVGLYTSRVILRTLGVVDYGIYNVVGGVIAMFGFLTGSMGAACSRFITYDLGKGDREALKKTFGNILTIYLVLAIVILILSETIGLWFVYHELKIPAPRFHAALWVYQFSVFSALVGIISVPFNSVIIAHEHMSAFAYISILDAVLKLVIVYLLVVLPYDKLIVYSVLLFCIQCVDRIIYSVYCTRHFEETRTKLSFDKKQFKEIFVFAGWTMNGNLAFIGFTQGLNILLNIFFGPAVNAARGVAVQVQNVVQQFCSNFQMALNPQITKSYANGNLPYMHKLLNVSSKFSFFLLMLISLPLMLEAKTVLHLWLGIVPDHTVNFLRWILCISLLFTLSNPIIISVHATGNLKKFQLIEGSMLLTIVPIAYLLLKFFAVPPESVFFVHLCVESVTQFVRLKIVLPMIGMKISDYFHKTLIPIIKVSILAPIIPLIIYIELKENMVSFFIVCIVSVLCISTIIYWVGCTTSERIKVKEKMVRIYSKLSFRHI